jgi:hypothetical protein
VLGIQITDDDDPYFLCSLLVTEEDFKSLKVEQGLLVDFDHFPSQLVRLLDECVSGRDKAGSRYFYTVFIYVFITDFHICCFCTKEICCFCWCVVLTFEWFVFFQIQSYSK